MILFYEPSVDTWELACRCFESPVFFFDFETCDTHIHPFPSLLGSSKEGSTYLQYVLASGDHESGVRIDLTSELYDLSENQKELERAPGSPASIRGYLKIPLPNKIILKRCTSKYFRFIFLWHIWSYLFRGQRWDNDVYIFEVLGW